MEERAVVTGRSISALLRDAALHEGEVVAFTFAMFAFGLTVIPAIGVGHGWGRGLAASLAACFIVTAYCGVSNYAEKAAAKLAGIEAAGARYRDARTEIEAVRSDM